MAAAEFATPHHDICPRPGFPEPTDQPFEYRPIMPGSVLVVVTRMKRRQLIHPDDHSVKQVKFIWMQTNDFGVPRQQGVK